MDQVFDVAIIGGGINGCGCAADAALRGLSVVLLEQGDLASQTSSSSTKLIHGGLRYIEHYEFNLVKKALTERQRLLDLAPYLVQPQLLVLPITQQMRPAWFLSIGLFLYDNLSKTNRLPKYARISKKNNEDYFSPLIAELDKGFIFYDAITDDSRLTLINAIQAREHGASIRTHAKVTQVETKNNIWELTIQPTIGPIYILYAKSLINAAGAWVNSIIQLAQRPTKQQISLIQGSHIVVPQMYEGKQAYFLQNPDKRLVFVIPYHGYSMIGTTDIPFSGDLNRINISEDEIDYLLNAVNLYFNNKLRKQDILYTWSGVRTLLANNHKKAQELSRDYDYELFLKPAPMISIYSGKMTTYRQLAVEVVDKLACIFPNLPASKTAFTPLPGSVFKQMDFKHYVSHAKEKYYWMEPQLLNHYLYTYGCRMEQFLEHCNNEASLGKKFSTLLYQIEVDYLILEEWAQTSEDILKRRTKLDLMMDALSKQELEHYLSKVKKASPLHEPI